MGQLVLPLPYVTVFVFVFMFVVWAMMLNPKYQLCVKIVEKYVTLMGGVYKNLLWTQPKRSGVTKLINYYPITPRQGNTDTSEVLTN